MSSWLLKNTVNININSGWRCAFSFRDTSASPVINPMAFHYSDSNIRKSHNVIVEREMSRPVTSLGHQWGRRDFWEEAKFFKLQSSSFKLCSTHFSRGGGKIPCAFPCYGPANVIRHAVITVRAAVANLMLSGGWKILAGRSCRTPTKRSHEPPLGIQLNCVDIVVGAS